VGFFGGGDNNATWSFRKNDKTRRKEENRGGGGHYVLKNWCQMAETTIEGAPTRKKRIIRRGRIRNEK